MIIIEVKENHKMWKEYCDPVGVIEKILEHKKAGREVTLITNRTKVASRKDSPSSTRS